MKASAFLGLFLIFVVLMNPAGTARSEEPPGAGGRGAQAALGTAFTYQGFLRQAGNPATGSQDFRFILYDSEVGGSQVGITVERTGVSVSGGLFTVALDFGAGAFDGQARWLDIAVRPAGSVDYTPLAPRQALSPAPYALYATSAGAANSASSASTATSASAAPWSGLTGVPAGFADGVDNDTDHTGAYWSTSGNAGTSGASFLGTTDNFPVTLAVSGTPALRLERDVFGGFNVIEGFIGTSGGNSASPGVGGATIGGGGAPGSVITCCNHVTDHVGTVSGGKNNRAGDDAGTVDDAMFATVGGGSGNRASATSSTVAGGFANTASGADATVTGGFTNTASALRATVAGGDSNIASGTNSTVSGGTGNAASNSGSTVAGGGPNTASGFFSAVSGGGLNTASGRTSIVAGGEGNTAAGDWSFAAGRRAKIAAANDGSFVFADSTDADFNSFGANRFDVRASGGASFQNSAGVGPVLPAGSNNWVAGSDRNVKANFAPVDGQEVLARVAALPLSTWNLVSQDPSIRHMGPMAQDFYAAFGLGEDDLHIGTVDADGVALAAIQGLNQALQENQAVVGDLKAENAALEARNTTLEARLAALEARLLAAGVP